MLSDEVMQWKEEEERQRIATRWADDLMDVDDDNIGSLSVEERVK